MGVNSVEGCGGVGVGSMTALKEELTAISGIVWLYCRRSTQSTVISSTFITGPFSRSVRRASVSTAAAAWWLNFSMVASDMVI